MCHSYAYTADAQHWLCLSPRPLLTHLEWNITTGQECSATTQSLRTLCYSTPTSYRCVPTPTWQPYSVADQTLLSVQQSWTFSVPHTMLPVYIRPLATLWIIPPILMCIIVVYFLALVIALQTRLYQKTTRSRWACNEQHILYSLLRHASLDLKMAQHKGRNMSSA